MARSSRLTGACPQLLTPALPPERVEHWLTALESLPAVRWIAEADYVYPTVSALHILGLALLVGPIILADVNTLRGQDAQSRNRQLIAAAKAGLVLAAATGATLFAVRASEYAFLTVFQVKLLLIAAAVLNALFLAPRRNRLAAGLSLGLWLAALFAGRFIAFASPA